MSDTSEQFEAVERELLEDMKSRRDALNRAITSLESELAHPHPPLDWNEINVWLEEQRKWREEYNKKVELETKLLAG